MQFNEESFNEDYSENPAPPVIHFNVPTGESLTIHGFRQSPLNILISKETEYSPKRDAKMLATYLSCSIDEQTIFHLAEFLFAEYLAPIWSDSRVQLQNAVSASSQKKPRKPKRVEE